MDYDRYKNLPNKLKEYRKAKGLTQNQVAQVLGFRDKTWVSHWENGDALPNLISAIRLSKVYQVTLDCLFSDLIQRVDLPLIPLRCGVQEVQGNPESSPEVS